MDLFKIFGTIAVKNEEANQSIDETKEKAESAESGISGAFKKIGAAVVTYLAVDKIIEFGKSITEAAASVAAEQSAFEQIMGDYSNTAQQKVNEIADATGMVDTRLTPYMTSMTAKFKGLGFDIDEATTLASDGLTVAADAAAFWDKSLDESMDGLNSFVNGNYEGGEAIGLFANDTQMASYAVKQGIVSETKEWANLDEARKQATRLQYAQDMMKASGATGQAAKEADQYANVQANLTEKWRQFKAQIGEPVLQNIVLPAMEKLSGLVDTASAAFEKASGFVSEHKNEISLLGGVLLSAAAGVGAFLLVINWGSIMTAATQAITILKGAFIALNTVMSANPIGLVIAAITALVVGFMYLWNTSDSFRNFWIGLWEKIKAAASGVWDAIQSAADTVINALRSGWEAFSGFFSGLWDGIVSVVSSVWETIKNVVTVGIMLIGQIISAAIQIITLPWQFIWQNCSQYIIAAWETIKSAVSNAVNAVKNVITTVFNAVKSVITASLNGWKNIIITVWNAIKSAVTTVVNAIKTVISTVFNAIKNVITPIMNSIKSVISTVWNAVKSTVTSVMNSIKSTVSNVWNSVKTTVSNAINKVKSTISSGLNSAKSTVSSVLGSIKSKFSSIMGSARDIVKSAIDRIKGFFKFSWSLPKLKLPHISISGKFSINPPSVPKFGIEWYKDGGIMENPTLFGINHITGRAMVGGEAGPEAIAPIDKLQGYVSEVVRAENGKTEAKLDRLIALLEKLIELITSFKDMGICLDSGEIVGALIKRIDAELGDLAALRGRGQ